MSTFKHLFIELKNGMQAGWNSAPPTFKLWFKVFMGMGALGFFMGILVYASAIVLMVAAAWRLVTGG
jgi:hypothetical protein